MFKNMSSHGLSLDNCLAEYISPNQNLQQHPQTSSLSSDEQYSQSDAEGNLRENQNDFSIRQREEKRDNSSRNNSQSHLLLERSKSLGDLISDSYRHIPLEEQGACASISPKKASNLFRSQGFDAINYRKLLSTEVQRSKNLQKLLWQRNKKNEHLFELVKKLKEENEILNRMLEKSKQVVLKKDSKMKNIDHRIEEMKTRCRTSNQREEVLERQLKRGKAERRQLRKENQKYRLFINALFESVGILNGKKIESLPKLWEEWKGIFQELSLARCAMTYPKKGHK